MTGYPIGADQKTPDWRVKTTFLWEADTTIRLPIKPWLGELAFH